MVIAKEEFERSVIVRGQLESGQDVEWCPLPPPGQLPLAQIIALKTEEDVNALLKARYPQLKPDYASFIDSLNPLNKALFPAFKRLALSRLEGCSYETIADNAAALGLTWTEPTSIRSTLSKYAHPDVRSAIEQNNASRIRLAAIQSDPKLQPVLSDISRLTELRFDELFEHLPVYREEGKRSAGKSQLRLPLLLAALKMRLEGHGKKEVAFRLSQNAEFNPAGSVIRHGSLNDILRRSLSRRAYEKLLAIESMRGEATDENSASTQ